MPLAHYPGTGRWIPILFDEAKEYIKSKLTQALLTFENIDISLNGKGKNVVYTTSTHPMRDRSNYFKEEITENGIIYTVYTIEDEDDHSITKYYTIDNQIHRIGLPAYSYHLEQLEKYAYFDKGKLHRIDGPAIIYKNVDGSMFRYWIDDVTYTPEEYNKKLRKNKLEKLNGLTTL